MPADWITGAGMSIAVATSAGAKIRAARDALETRGARLTGRPRISRGTPGNDEYGYHRVRLVNFHQTVLKFEMETSDKHK